jgi:hypothetical protein
MLALQRCMGLSLALFLPYARHLQFPMLLARK